MAKRILPILIVLAGALTGWALAENIDQGTNKPLTFFVSDGNGFPMTGLAVKPVVSKNGGAFALASGTTFEITRGYYRLDGNVTDTDTLGSLIIDGNYPVTYTTQNVYWVGVNRDANFSGLAALITKYDGNIAFLQLKGVEREANTAYAQYAIPLLETRAGRDANWQEILRRVPNAVPGAAGGLFIAGSNAATTIDALTITNLTTFTGAVSMGSTFTIAGATAFTGAVSMPAGLTANITGNLSGTVGTVTTLTTWDKTGYALSTAGVAVVADGVWDEVLTTATHNVANSAGRRLRSLASVSIVDGTAVAGGTQTITLNGDAIATAHAYNQNLVVITDGNGVGQSRMVLEYTAGKVATVDRPWVIVPDLSSTYQIMAFNGMLLADHGYAVDGNATTIQLGTTALSTASSYVGSAIYITGGAGIGQMRLITAYTTGRLADVTPNWETNPDATSIYKLIPVGRSLLAPNQHVITDSGTVTIGDPNVYRAVGVLDLVQAEANAIHAKAATTEANVYAGILTRGTSTLTQAQATAESNYVKTYIQPGGAADANQIRYAANAAASGSDPNTVAGRVWDIGAAQHATGGTMGALLGAAGGAADPLLNAVPGSYADGTAGKALGSVTAIKAKTDLIATGWAVTIISAVAATGNA
ncbi:MAG: hypothetical protein IMZ55_18825, partial [Acidobacteria bacterium]|nr:hypothetical protein [Acidobacteriota bacterium]